MTNARSPAASGTLVALIAAFGLISGTPASPAHAASSEAISPDLMPAAADRTLGGFAKTCGPDSGELGGQCLLEAPGFPGGTVTVGIEVSGELGNETEWSLDNFKQGGGCSGSFTPADPPRTWTCTVPAGTLSLVASRPPGASAEISMRW